jgi:hypothetical protein
LKSFFVRLQVWFDKLGGKDIQRVAVAGEHTPPELRPRRAGVQCVLDPLHICDRREVCAFREVLSDEAVGVFVQAAFPGMVGLGEVGPGVEQGGDLSVGGKLFSVVVGEGLDPLDERREDLF